MTLEQQRLWNVHLLDADNEMIIEQSCGLSGQTELSGAKNSVLVIMASLLLTEGISVLKNVPWSADVYQMILLLQSLGASVTLNKHQHEMVIDTRCVDKWYVCPEMMKKMRASILVMGPLLVRFGRAEIAFPGGCVSLGKRPIDFHLKNFEKMGVTFESHDLLIGVCKKLQSKRLVLEYPSVGATENLMMAAALTKGRTEIINAALEPEVLDLIAVLKKMGANIEIVAPATIWIEGVDQLIAVEHSIMYDRLEVGSLLLAAAITKGEIYLPQADASILDVFLLKLDEMGHSISIGQNQQGISFKATQNPKAVSFRTAPYPGFPTDLQAPMMAVLCLAEGTSEIQESVFESRYLHIFELQKMGAYIQKNGDNFTIVGVEQLYGTHVIASDIRASCALALAGLAAYGTTHMSGLHHWRRGYETLEQKLINLGAKISFKKSLLPDQSIHE